MESSDHIKKAKALMDLLTSAQAVASQLKDVIDDDIDSSEDFDDHQLAPIHKAAYGSMKSVENLIMYELQNDAGGNLLNAFDKLLTIEALAGRKSSLSHLLKRFRRS